MSHSSGIPVSSELDHAFSSARTTGGIRSLQVFIKDDKLVPGASQPLGSSFDADFAHIATFMVPKQPCYIVFRLDSKNMTGFEWLLIHYAPEGATVKDRMLYASTRELLKRQLGASYFADEMFASMPSEASLEAYRSHRAAKSGAKDVPLTANEVQAAQARHMEVAVGTSKEYVHSVQFPLSAQATEQLAALAAGKVNFVLLLVEPVKETIELAAARTVTAADLPAQFPSDEPRFGLFTHQHEGQPAVVFIYSCPNDSKVKLKMLYSTVKSAVLVQAEAKGVKVAKKIEIQNPSEASQEAIAAEFGGGADAAAKPSGFDKPSRPGRGAPRLIRK